MYEKMSKKKRKKLVTKKMVLKFECRGYTSAAPLQLKLIIIVQWPKGVN